MSYIATSSIGGQTDAEIVAWVNAKLVSLVETYFDVFVHRVYQKPHMVTDPVIGIQLPNSMATAIQHLDGETIHCRQILSAVPQRPLLLSRYPFRFNS